MLLFLDTEYSGLGQRPPRLISLALVAEDGSREFYIELADTWSPDDCAPFVQQEVLPLLTGPRLPRAEACAALREWFSQAPRAVQVACDSETDWCFLLDLLGRPLPVNLAAHYYDLPRFTIARWPRTTERAPVSTMLSPTRRPTGTAGSRGWMPARLSRSGPVITIW